MLQDEVVALEDDRVRVSHSPGLRVVVEEPHTTVPAGRHRVEVRYALEVSAPDAGGTLMITTLSRGDLLLTALVGVGNHYELLPESGGQGSVRTFTLEVARGEARRLVVIEHPADLAPELLPGLLPEPDALWRREPVPPTQAEHSRGTRARPPRVDEPLGGAEGGPFPEAAAPEAPAPEAPPPEEVAAEAAAAEEAAPEEVTAETAAPGAPPSPVQAVLAEVGANMPSAVHLDDTVPVEVLLSREEVTIFGGTSHDEQVIVMDPDRPLDVVLLRRGFDLDDRELPHETGRRSLSLPAVGKPAVRVVFWLRAAQEGEGEVQVVVRQDAPQPLATLRLTATVSPPSAAPADRASAQADLEARSQGLRVPLAGRVTPFLNPRSLVIDENLVGGVSELSFDLVLPHVRRRFTRVVRDKTAVLKEVFRRLDVAWRDIKPLEDPQARSRAFHDSLRALGSWLALEVLPPQLLDDLRHHLGDIDELAVITSGETDIPWELVHVWDPDDGDDPDGRGFLGRMGLVRWVYNTGHPTELSVRAGRAHYLIPAYVDPTLALEQTQLEPTYLKPFGATAIEPPDATGIARLITSGQVDLLHFAGHGFSNDTDVPAVREMVLADYRPGVVSVAGADRSRVAFGLEDLRGALPDSPFADPGPLVFLNACRIGEAPSTRSEVGGFAETFLRGGAGAFVGCLWSVGDQPAREFVAAFYEALDSGHTIAEATLAARRAAREAGDISWLAYTVYAHPDARLADRPLPPPDTDPSSKGTVMTTTEAARSVPDLTREELRAIHPFVVCMEDGRLAEGPSQLPVGVDDFHTVTADIDELFTRRVPDFITMHGKPVPMVLWAHGGLVDKATGLRVAHTQVAWWQANGVFPVHFVWRTGLAESLWDAVKDSLPGRARGLDDVFDTLIEAAVRGAHGKDVWGAMKTTAKLASEKDKGGAWYFAQKLAEFQAAHPGSVTVHAAGHSAGSIFHSYLIPQVLAAGVGEIASLNLLAPAIRVDEFKQRILKKSVVDRIRRLNLFTMTEAFEKDDTCLGIYHKSLLYLIRGALEDEPRAEILGLQECLQRDKDLAVLLGKAGSGAKGEVMWSRTVNGGPRTSSLSTSHGRFDNDAATMNSLARRVLDNDQLTAGFGTVAGTRGLAEDASPWPSEEAALDYIASRKAAKPRPNGKRALCIGIDQYPSVDDQLSGCVADARAWKQELQHAGFTVEILEDGDATRQHIVESIQGLILKSRPGDVLVVQYSGHGTTIDDLDGDEREEAKRTGETKDEALCPVDFREGELLIDDDLGQLWDLLPEDVNLTVFFDSCHSGGGQRRILEPDLGGPTRKARLVRMTAANVEAFKARRGGLPEATRSLDSERSVYFGACRATELAFESNGQGDFTRLALPRLREFLTRTNQQFMDAVLADFGEARRQTPVLLPPGLTSRTFLAPVSLRPKEGEEPALTATAEPPTQPLSTAGTTRRDQAVASVLRGIADLIDP